MILVIDNYDSFVYNLDRYLHRLGQETVVIRNDRVSMSSIDSGKYDAIIISPGPQSPKEAGCCVDVIQAAGKQTPILGVCLGHQAIAQAYGGSIIRARRPIHGQASFITHNQTELFESLPNPMLVGRYHSLIIDPTTLPPELTVTAWLADNTPAQSPDLKTIMAVHHKSFPVWGVQFHPESILTRGGYTLLANFLRLAGLSVPCAIPTDELISG